jgi:hypothetical protein
MAILTPVKRFEGHYVCENWSGTVATSGLFSPLGQNLPIQALWEQFWRVFKNKNLLNSQPRSHVYAGPCHSQCAAAGGGSHADPTKPIPDFRVSSFQRHR